MRLLSLILLLLLCVPLSGWAKQDNVESEVAAQSRASDEQPIAATPPHTLQQSAVNSTVTELARPAGLQGTERPTAGIGLGKMALSLLLVVAIVIALGWAFKKLTLRLPGSKHIKIISSMPLGPKERLLVIEMQGKQRVLGVTAHSINLLFELENSLPEEKLASDFHTQLQSFLKK